MKNLVNYLRNRKNIPKIHMYIVELTGCGERFIKIGICYIPHLQFQSFRSFGYKHKIISVLQFSCEIDARNEMEILKEMYANFDYIPLHKFPEPESCYKVQLLDGLDLYEISEHETMNEIDERVIEMLKDGIPGIEISKELNLSESKVSRIKKKYNV